MKVYIIAGEVSGDIYGAQIISNLLSRHPECEVRFWGGDAMLAVSKNIVKHIRETAFMGFVEVIKNIKTIKANFKLCKADILNFKPDVILFIDYPGFNLRIAKWAKQQSISTAYYIAPKVWAWKESRVKQIKQYVDKLYVIFPFEVEYFAKHEIEATYFGNPLHSRIESYKQANKYEKLSIALLPGSRNQEITRHLPLMYAYAEQESSTQFLLPLAQGYSEEKFYTLTGLSCPSNVTLIEESWKALHNAKYAIVASGTATLETMLFDVPQVVIYKANQISYWIAKRLLKIKYISLVNIIANKAVIAELIQHGANLQNLTLHLSQLKDSDTLDDYNQVKQSLSSIQDPIISVVDDLYSTFS